MTWSVARRVACLAAALVLFIVALHVMQEGARAVAPLLREKFELQGFWKSLGFGWLASYLTFGGSPVAAGAVSLLDGETIERGSALAMIIGSRIGGSLIVLAVGFVYWLAERHRKRSMKIGVLTLVVTATTYLPALLLGWGLLRLGFLADLAEKLPIDMETNLGELMAPLTRSLSEALPDWGVFLLGLALVVVSFKLFDFAVPEMEEYDPPSLLRRVEGSRWWMLTLGAAVTAVSLSVTISLGLLVPVAARRYVKVDQIVPYILGANVTTLADTLVASLVLGNPDAVAVVLAILGSVVVVSLVILLVAFDGYERAVLWLTERTMDSTAHLATFLAALVLVPGALLLL